MQEFTQTDPRRETRELVRRLIDTNAHVTVRDIARTLDLSTQRVYQITAALGLKQDKSGKWIGKKGAA